MRLISWLSQLVDELNLLFPIHLPRDRLVDGLRLVSGQCCAQDAVDMTPNLGQRSSEIPGLFAVVDSDAYGEGGNSKRIRKIVKGDHAML